jgi:hypothetical protein
VAITGNVFVRPPQLPKRVGVPQNLENWDLLNTVIS